MIKPVFGIAAICLLAACGGGGGSSEGGNAVPDPDPSVYAFAAEAEIRADGITFSQNGQDYFLETPVPATGRPLSTTLGWNGNSTAGPSFGGYTRGDNFLVLSAIDNENMLPMTAIFGTINTSPGTGSVIYDGFMRFHGRNASIPLDISLDVGFDDGTVTSNTLDVTLDGTITNGVISGPMTVTNLTAIGDTTGDFEGAFFGLDELAGVYQSDDGQVTATLAAETRAP